ncbi:hypothetical protein chiPu_0027656, partial [Chiloscyllium punctatum]|nr:hypothetical protein [Chiloscyllium punctatum]
MPTGSARGGRGTTTPGGPRAGAVSPAPPGRQGG